LLLVLEHGRLGASRVHGLPANFALAVDSGVIRNCECWALARRSSWLDPKLPPTVPASERRGLTGGVKAGSASVGWSELPWQGLSLVTTESPHVCSCAAALGRVVLPRHAIPSEQDMASLCASLEHGRPRAGLTQKRPACTWLNGPGCGQRRTPVAFSWNGRSCRGGSSGSGLAV